MDTGRRLKSETGKWLARMEKETGKTRAPDKKGEELLENIRAYMKDSRYFLGKGDLVRAFEAVVWAWAVFETARELGALKVMETR